MAEVQKGEEEVAKVERPKVEVVVGQLRPQRTAAISSTLRTVRTRSLVVAMAAGAREEAVVVRAVARAVARGERGGAAAASTANRAGQLNPSHDAYHSSRGGGKEAGGGGGK